MVSLFMNAKETIINYKMKHNKSNKQIAQLLQVSESNVSRWLSGKLPISPAWTFVIQHKLN